MYSFIFILPVWPAFKYDYVLHSTATAHSRPAEMARGVT